MIGKSLTRVSFLLFRQISPLLLRSRKKQRTCVLTDKYNFPGFGERTQGDLDEIL